MPRGTPLYGQPAWWGDDEADEKSGCKPDGKHEEKMHEMGASGKSWCLPFVIFFPFFKKIVLFFFLCSKVCMFQRVCIDERLIKLLV